MGESIRAKFVMMATKTPETVVMPDAEPKIVEMDASMRVKTVMTAIGLRSMRAATTVLRRVVATAFAAPI